MKDHCRFEGESYLYENIKITIGGHTNMTTLFEIKQNMGTIGQHMAKIDAELTAKAVDPQATRQDIQALQEEKIKYASSFRRN